MLLQTNSYVVPKDKRSEHVRVLRRFRQTLARLGCDMFEVYEQVGNNWSSSHAGGRFIQIMRFRDRKHQLAVQQAEQADPAAQQQIAEFCQLVNIPYQQQQGLFAVGYYTAALPVAPPREGRSSPQVADTPGVATPSMPEQQATTPIPVSIDAGPFEPEASTASETNGHPVQSTSPLSAALVTIDSVDRTQAPHNGNGELRSDIIDLPPEDLVVTSKRDGGTTGALDEPGGSGLNDNFDSLLDDLKEPSPADHRS